MEDSYSGKVSINEFFYPKMTDQSFLEFTGLGMNDPINGAVFPEDMPAMKTAVGKLISGECGQYVTAFRLRRADGEYVWESAEISLDGNDYNGEKIIHFNIFDPSSRGSLSERLENEQRVFEGYLDMLHGVLLKYSAKGDAFEIFYISGTRQNYLFKGTLDEWQKKSVDMLDAEYNSEFNDLCADIRAGTKNFRHTLKIAGIISSDKKDMCAFRCRTIQNKSGENIVLGCIEIDNKEKMKGIFLDALNDKDAALDMLNKRAAVEYANKIISRNDIKCSFFIILDLDNFKQVNDTYGHMTGDEVLVKATKIINENVGKRGIVGRMGGDEILIVTDSINEQTELRNMLRTIRTTIEWTFKNDPRNLGVTCSMGVAEYPRNGKNFKELFELCDKMLYLAKEKGKNRYVIYTPEVHDAIIYNTNTSSESKPDGEQINYSEDKLGISHRMIENYLIRRTCSNAKLFNDVGRAYALDEILIMYENGTVAFQWTPEGVSSDHEKIKHFGMTDEFSAVFDKDNVLVLDGLYKMGGRCADVMEVLVEKGIKSAVLYKIVRRGRMTGYIMFGRTTQRQRWSDYDVFSLSLTAKVFDVSIMDDIG